MDSLRRVQSTAVLEVRAQHFRDTYARGVLGFLELDAIVEFDLKLEIVVRKDLLRRTGTPGWLAVSGTAILVDEAFQRDCPQEYQSFLAHEIVHFLRHRSYVPGHAVSKDEFMAFHTGMSEELVAKLEWEAREMGLRIQMPHNEFQVIFADAVEHARDRFPSLNGPAEMFVVDAIAGHFGVSALRATVRMDRAWRQVRRIERIERDARRVLPAPNLVVPASGGSDVG